MFGWQRERGQSQFGQLPPGLGTVTGLGCNDPLARLEVIVLLGQPRHRVGEQLLFFGVLKVHVQSPRAILAKMLRWISFDPA